MDFAWYQIHKVGFSITSLGYEVKVRWNLEFSLFNKDKAKSCKIVNKEMAKSLNYHFLITNNHFSINITSTVSKIKMIISTNISSLQWQRKFIFFVVRFMDFLLLSKKYNFHWLDKGGNHKKPLSPISLHFFIKKHFILAFSKKYDDSLFQPKNQCYGPF